MKEREEGYKIMINIEEIELFFESNPMVYEEALNYIGDSFEKGVFEEPERAKMPESFGKQLIQEKDSKVLIRNEYLNYMLIKYFQAKHDIENIDSIEKYLEITGQLQEELNKIKDRFEYSQKLISFILVYLNRKKKLDIELSILSIKKENKKFDFFNLMYHYIDALPDLYVEKEKLLLTLEHFLNEAKGDLAVGMLYSAIQEYCKKQKVAGINFIKYLIEQKKGEFLPNAMIGLAETDFKASYEKAKEIFNNSDLKRESIVALGNLKYYNIIQFEEALNLLLSVDSDNDEITGNLCGSFIILLDNKFIDTNGNLDKVKHKLNVYSKTENPFIQISIVMALSKSKIEIHQNEKFEILMNIIKISQENRGIVERIDYLLAKIQKPVMVLNYVSEYILKNDVKDRYDLFSFSMGESYKKHPSEFIMEFVRMLIHPKGAVRFFANSKIEIIKLNNSNKKSWIEVLGTLTISQKKKFLSSILMGFFKIEERIEISILILKQHDENLFKELLQQFVWLLRDFGAEVKNRLENNLDMKDNYEKNFYNAFIEFFNRHTSILKRKDVILEFDPVLNQTKYYNKFKELYDKKTSESFQEKVCEKITILKIFKKTNISRGEFFGLEGECGSSPIVETKNQYIFPRTLLTFPEMYDYVRRVELSEDWSEEND